MSALFALVGARFPDFGQLLNTISIFLFLLTPIIWYVDTVPASSTRGQLMRLNPFFHMVEIVRAPIMGNAVEAGTLWYVAGMSVIGLLVATVAYRRYARYVPLWI